MSHLILCVKKFYFSFEIMNRGYKTILRRVIMKRYKKSWKTVRKIIIETIVAHLLNELLTHNPDIFTINFKFLLRKLPLLEGAKISFHFFPIYLETLSICVSSSSFA